MVCGVALLPLGCLLFCGRCLLVPLGELLGLCFAIVCWVGFILELVLGLECLVLRFVWGGVMVALVF